MHGKEYKLNDKPRGSVLVLGNCVDRLPGNMWRKAEFGYYDISLYCLPLLVNYDYHEKVNGRSVNNIRKICFLQWQQNVPLLRQSIAIIKAGRP